MDTTARTPPFGIATAVALLLGITACLCLPALLSWPLWPLFAAPLALGAWLWTRRDWKRIAGACLLGFGLCGLHVAHALSQQLPLEMERQDFIVTGRVVDLPADEARRTRCTHRVDDDAAVPEQLRRRLRPRAWYAPSTGGDTD